MLRILLQNVVEPLAVRVGSILAGALMAFAYTAPDPAHQGIVADALVAALLVACDLGLRKLSHIAGWR